MNLKDLGIFAFALAVTAAQGSAHAGAITFTDASCISGTAGVKSATCNTTSAGTNYDATLSGWSGTSSTNFATAYTYRYSGYGLGISTTNEPTSNPQHTVDNNGSTEAFLINFGSSNFALNQLSLGYVYNDADISILRYTGTEAPTLTASNVSNLKNAAGWEFVGNYANLSTSTPLNFNNTGTVKTASWWLVSAYNSAYSPLAPTTNLSNSDDFFKLSGFGGSIVTPPPAPNNSVPEPGTFALLGVAVLGFAAARRKSKAK